MTGERTESNKQIQERKSSHIRLCQDSDVEAKDRFTGFSDFHFTPEALPELNSEEVDTSAKFLGTKFSAPILISAMTGGVQKGESVNRVLAKVAQSVGIPMGLGSQRMAIDTPEFEKHFILKDEFPQLFLMGNVGFTQLLREDYLDFCNRAVEMVQANALVIHLNAIQECIQPEGNRNFKGILQRIGLVAKNLAVPVVVKEVGSGIKRESALRLKESGVAAIDIAGRGGTSWGYIEGLRSEDPGAKSQGEIFRSWGIPTAYNLKAIREDLTDFPIVASGGIRDGLTIAKAVALGADMVGLALPFLKAALESEDRAMDFFEELVRTLKIVMVATGSRNLDDLSSHLHLGHPYVPHGRK